MGRGDRLGLGETSWMDRVWIRLSKVTKSEG